MTKHAERVLADIIEHHTDIFIRACEDDNERREYWGSMEYFFKQFLHNLPEDSEDDEEERKPSKRSKVGSIFVRRRMAEIIMLACHNPPYKFVDSNDDENAEGGASSREQVTVRAMVQWQPSDWKRLIKKMYAAHHLLVRKDASKQVFLAKDEEPEDHPGRIESPLYNKQFERLMELLGLQKGLSHIRYDLEFHLRATKNSEDEGDDEEDNGEVLSIPQTKLDNFR